MKAALFTFVLLSMPAVDVAAIQFGLPSAVVPSGLGLNTHWNTTVDPATMALFAGSGVDFNRVDMKWSDIEQSSNSYTFGAYPYWGYDDVYGVCAADGIRNLFIVDPNSAMTMYGNNATTSAWQTAFTNYAAAVAAQYAGDGNIYEICNEPMNATNGLQTASVYTAVAAQVYSAMKTADPTCTILAGSTPNINSNSGQTWLKSCIRDGLLNGCDAVSVHPYNGTDAPELFPTRYAAVTALMPKYGGKTLPLVTSEWGVTTTDPGITPQVQGDYLARYYLVNLYQGIPLSIAYDFQDNKTGSPNRQDNFGVVESDLTPKLAYGEIQLLTSSLAGETYSGKVSDANGDWLLVFTGGGHTTLAAWTTGSSHFVGNVSGWGAVNLTLTGTPQYVDPAPEPGTLVLLGTGLLATLVYVWRKWR